MAGDKNMADRRLPERIYGAVVVLDAWVVGTSAEQRPGGGGREGEDIDIMIPWSRWPEASALIVPKHARPNAFGGWKWEESGVSIDMWPDTLDRLAASNYFRSAWHVRTGLRFVSHQEEQG